MSAVWFYTMVLSFASGIFLRSFFEIGWPVSVWLLVVAGGLGIVGYQKRSAFSVRYISILAISLVGLGIGMLRLEVVNLFHQPSPLEASLGEKVTLHGEVVREPELRAKSTHLVVQVGGEKILIQTDRHSPIQYGDTLAIEGTLQLPKMFITDLGRDFDYPKYLASQGIAYTMSFAKITVTDTTARNPFLKKLYAWKQSYMNALESALPEPQVGLGEGLILGVKQALGPELEDAFRRSGIIHIVVLSGYNIMIVVGFVMTLLAYVVPLRLRIVVGLVSILVFALLVGGGASVVRASIMSALALLALGLGRQYALMRALCIAGTVMLFFNPLLLVHDVGFQLSFIATLGLILVAPQFEELLQGRLRNFGIKEFLIATAATQIAVLPLLLYQIGQFSLIAIVVNALVLPVVSFAMLFTFLTGLVALVSTSLALPFAYIAYGLLTYIIVIATRFAELPFAAFEVSAFPFIFVPCMYALMGCVLYRKLQSDKEPAQLALPSDVSGWTIEVETDGATLSSIENRRDKTPSPALK